MAALAVGLVVASCGSGGAEDPPAPVEFVAFRQRELVIASLGTPVRAPVVVGSTISPRTILSEAPQVVSIRSDGLLVAHREGTTVVRSVAQPEVQLRVRVILPVSLQVDPLHLELEAGDEIELRLLAATRPVPNSAARWLSSDASVALVRDGRVEVRSPGTATITAEYGDARASAQVTVRAPPDAALLVRPERIRVRAGTRVPLEVLVNGRAVSAVWDVSPTRLLRIATPTTAVAVSPGQGHLCATAAGLRRCIPFTIQ